jgi:hypothetical protein
VSDDIGADFAAFIKWRDAENAKAAEADFEVPLFEQGADGTQRSATLPYSQAKRLLGTWWPDLFPAEGEGDGGSGGAQGAQGAQGGASGTTPVKDFFGGKRGAQGAPPARSA